MTVDPYALALAGMEKRSLLALAPAFAAGLYSSAGPCVAPRFIAVAALASGASARRRIAATAAFVGGVVTVYAALGAVSSLLPWIAAASRVVYTGMAIALAAAGLSAVALRAPRCADVHERPARTGSAFFAGAASAFVVSPCCTPLAAAVVLYASGSSDTGYAAALLACFALGHTLPLFLVGGGLSRVACALTGEARAALDLIGGTLMLALSCYYAVLA